MLHIYLRNNDIPFIINSSFTKRNQNDIKNVYKLAKSLGATAWYMFLIVPTGRGEELMKELVEKEDYEEALVELSSELLDRADLLGKIKDLEAENRKLLLERKRIENEYDFIVTTPNDTSSVYGEIREQLSNAKKEVLVCSPWITYLVDEFGDFNKKINLKVIANFREEDVKSGITDLDKFRVLKNLGAEIRYNNKCAC